tara:strand:- start:1168 stop:1401 length:234 start_codon:yes stop_codon:yes gene_type:complete
MADNAFELMVEQDVDTVLDTVVKDNFYWREWYNGTLFINGLSREIMDKVLDKLQYVFGNVQMHRCGITDEYAFDFCE